MSVTDVQGSCQGVEPELTLLPHGAQGRASLGYTHLRFWRRSERRNGERRRGKRKRRERRRGERIERLGNILSNRYPEKLLLPKHTHTHACMQEVELRLVSCFVRYSTQEN